MTKGIVSYVGHTKTIHHVDGEKHKHQKCLDLEGFEKGLSILNLEKSMLFTNMKPINEEHEEPRWHITTVLKEVSLYFLSIGVSDIV